MNHDTGERTVTVERQSLPNTSRTDGSFELTTIGDHPPVGLSGSGLLDLVSELRRAAVIAPSGRLVKEHPVFDHRLSADERGVPRLLIADKGIDLRGAESLKDAQQIPQYLAQHDILQMQKAKGAIRAATEIPMAQPASKPHDLERMILTGSFGSQLNVEAVVVIESMVLPGGPPA